MRRSKGHPAQALEAEDALSLDDLDKVVGGRAEGDYSGSGYTEGPRYEGPTTPVVHAPDNLPTPIAAVETQVTNDSITGDQAVTQIAAIIGNQPDDHMHSIAGAEIASLIGRGELSATSAMADLHNAVTGHVLTGDQAAGVLAGIILAQYTTAGESVDIATAAQAEVAALISQGLLTADHAITAFAAAAGEVGSYSSMPLLGEIVTIARDNGVSAEHVATDIGAAVDSGDITGKQAVTVLAAVAQQWDYSNNNNPMMAAAGHEVADLVNNHGVSASDAMAGITAAYYQSEFTSNRLPNLLAAIVEADPALASAAGAELAGHFARDPWGFWTSASSAIESAVTSHSISHDNAMSLLLATAHSGQGAWAAQAASDMIYHHTFNTAQVMTDIQNAVASHAATGDDAVKLLLGLATNGGFGATYAPSVEATLVQMINAHQVTAAEAVADIQNMLVANSGSSFYSYQALHALLSIGAANTPDAQSALTAGLNALIANHSYTAEGLVGALASMVGSNSLASENAAYNTGVMAQVSALVVSGAVTADAAIGALAEGTMTSWRWTGRDDIAAEIAAIGASANPPLSATQIVADVRAHVPPGYDTNGIILLGMLAERGSDLCAAAGAQLASFIDPNNYYMSSAHSVMTTVAYWGGSSSGYSATAAVGMLTAAVGDGTGAFHADTLGSAISTIISSNHITAAQATAGIHAAVAGNTLNVDAALTALAHMAMSTLAASPANASAVNMAVNGEIVALISGHFITAGHATEVLNALAADAANSGNTFLQTVVAAELAVVASSDPASAVFQGLSLTTSDIDLESAATQLAAMMQNGTSSISTVMADIDRAFTQGILNAHQAATLLVDIGCHGNLAAQTAAGAEFAKIVATTGASIFPVTGFTIEPYQAILSCIGVGLGARSTSISDTVALPMTHEAALAFVLGAIGSPATSDANRVPFQTAMVTLVTGNWYGVPVFFPAPTYSVPGMYSEFAGAVSDIAAAHAMPGPELIRAIFVMQDRVGADHVLQTLVGNQSISLADVHAAITSGWWQEDNAVKVLAGLSSTPAVMAEINALLADGTISVTQLLNDIHVAVVPPPYNGAPAAPLSVDDYVRIMESLTATGNAATQTAVVNELATVILNGQLSISHVQEILAAAGSNQAAMVDQLIGAANGHLLGALVNANLTTLDHAISVLAGNQATLFDAIRYAEVYGTIGIPQLTDALTHAISVGTLSVGTAMNMAIYQMAFSIDATLASMAGALMAAAVGTGQITANAAMAEITNHINQMAHLPGGAPGISPPQAIVLLNSFVAHANPAYIGAACQEVMNLVAYNMIPASQAVPTIIGFGDNAGPAALHAIGGGLVQLLNRGETIYSIETAINAAVGDGSLSGARAMALYAGIAEGVSGQAQSEALGQITALMQGGHGTAQDAVAALAGVAGSYAAITNPSLVQLVGDQLNAIVAAHPEALAGIGDAISGGTLTGSLAASMLLGMTRSWNIPAGVVDEINALVNANLMSPTEFMQALNNSVTSSALSPDGAITLLANCWPGANAAFTAQAAGTIVYMIQSGQINATQAVHDINGTINHPLSVGQAIGMMTAICTPNNPTISVAVADNLTQILRTGAALMSLDQVIAGIDHAVMSGHASADNAVTLLTKLAPLSTEAAAAAAQEIVGLIANNQISAAAAVSYVTWATAGAADHGITFLIDIAANSTSACQLAFGTHIANLVGQGTITADQAVGFVRDAYAAHRNNPVHEPYTPGFVTAAQELKLLANILAGMASPGHLDATSLIAPVHAELLAAMHAPPYRATDTQVVAALQEVGLSGGPILAAMNEEIDRLEADPKVMIDVAAQTGQNMSEVGGQLATLISQGTLSVGDAMSYIVAANAAHNLTNDQAVTMLVSAVAHAASAGIYLQQQTTMYANNWLLATASTLERLVQNGLSPDAVGNAFHAVIGQGPNLLSPSDAIDVLASTAAYADLQGMAATQIVGILSNPGFHQYPHQVAFDIASGVSGLSVPGGLTADAAVQLLARVAATIDSPTIYGGIAQGLGEQSSLTQIPPETVASAVTAMVQNHSLTPDQALHFLAPYGASAPGTVGHAIGALIASNQVSMADFTALIFGGPLQNSTQIQNTSYWQQVVGTGNVMFDTAVVMLAAMTSQTDLAVNQLAQIAAADSSFVYDIVASRIMSAGLHPETSGLNPREAVRAITILAADHSLGLSGSNYVASLADKIGQLVGAATATTIPAQYYMPYGEAVAEVARLSVNSNADVAQAGMTILNVLIGQTAADGNDGIVAAVGHGITADQAITILTTLSTTQTLNMQQHVRADIAYLIAHGDISATQAFADVHNACISQGIGAGQELALFAGIYSAAAGNSATQQAVAQEIDALIASGRFTIGQVMDGLAQGTFLPNTAHPTPAQAQAAYINGGLESGASAALMAMIAAGSSDPAAPGAMAGLIASMVSENRMDLALAMGGIDAAVASGSLSAANAVTLLASMPLNVSDQIHDAAGSEFAGLISNGRITLDQTVAAIADLAHDGQAMQQLQAGAALGLLNAQNQLSTSAAVADVVAALSSHALTAGEALAMLSGMAASGSPALASAATDEIAALIRNGSQTSAQAVSLLLLAAENGTGTMLNGVATTLSTLIAGDAIDLAQAMQAIDGAFRSGALPTSSATALLVSIANSVDSAVQVAVGHEIGLVIQAASNPASAIAALSQQLGANVSQDQAVVILASAIAGAGPATQTPLAALIATMVNNGPIGIAQVLSDIDAAVAAHTLPATQALIALSHLEEAVPNTLRTAVVNEATALVSNGHVSAADAAQTLIGAAHSGSTALQSLVGGMLAFLADHGLLTNQQVVEAITGASATINNSEALAVLMGMGVNGNAAAQEASGAGILSLIQNGRLDPQTVTQLISYQSTHNGITPEHGLQVLLNVMGAAVGDLNAGATGVAGGYDKYIRDQMMDAAVDLVQNVRFYSGGAHGVLLEVAGHSMALAEAVGRCCAALGTNSAIIGGSELAAAVTAGRMSADEGMMVAFASSLSGQSQGQWTFINFVQTAGLSMDQALHFLVVAAAHSGASDPNLPPNLAYSEAAAADARMMNAAFADMVALIRGIPGVPSQTTSAALFNEVVAAVTAHDLNGMQAASMLALLAGRLDGADAVLAAGAIGSLVTQHAITSEDGLHAIGWTIGSRLDGQLAKLMYASMALSADPAVQNIAGWAFSSSNLPAGPDALTNAFHQITSSPLFTHSQALTIICNIATHVNFGDAGAQLAAEIKAMVASHQITADQALTALATGAATSHVLADALGHEIAVLVGANLISFNQVMRDLSQAGLPADQIINALVVVSNDNRSFDFEIVRQISLMVEAHTITAAQAMADIARSPQVALHLLAMCVNSNPGMQDAAAAQMAHMVDAGAVGDYSFYQFAMTNFDRLHALGWVVAVASYGSTDLQGFVDTQFRWDRSLTSGDITSWLMNFAPLTSAHVQYYIGVEVGRFADRAVTARPDDNNVQVIAEVLQPLEVRISGTEARQWAVTTPGATAANTAKLLNADTAAIILLGLTSTTHSSEGHDAASKDLRSISSQVTDQFVIGVAQALPPDQALTQMINIVQNGWAGTPIVAHQLAEMIGAGTLTAQQVIAAMSALDTNHQLALVTDILAHDQPHTSAFVSQFATLTLLTWGVAPTSQTYTQLHEALAQVVPEFVGLARGNQTAAQTMTDLRSIAAANNVSVDLLMMATYHAATQDTSLNTSALSSALSTIGHEIYSHLTNGSAAQTIANLVLGGGMTEAAATAVMRELAGCATIPPNDIMAQVQSGQMSVWYAEAHHPGWANNTAAHDFVVAQAVGMMLVDVHVAHDIAAVLNGSMTVAQAASDLQHAGTGSEYAVNLGLMALAHALAVHGVDTLAVDAALANHISTGATENMLVSMANHGWLTPQAAVDMLRAEIDQAMTGITGDPAALFEAMALARLDLAASGRNGAIQNLLENGEATKILTGLGALQLVETSTNALSANIALAQHVTQVLAAQMAANDTTPPSEEQLRNEGLTGLPLAAQLVQHYAHMASGYFMLGVGYAQTGLGVICDKFAPAGDIRALTTDPGSVQKWVDLGVDVAVSGVPGQGLLNGLFDAGLPGWSGGLQSMALNEMIGQGAGGAFAGVNIGSHVAVMILEIPAVDAWLAAHGDPGVTHGIMKSVAIGCELVSGLISGAFHTAANMMLHTSEALYNTFRDVCTGRDATESSIELGKALFVYMTGGTFDSVQHVGEDVGAVMVDLFSGSPQQLNADAEKLGLDTVRMLTSHPLIQMAGDQFKSYGDKVDKLLMGSDEALATNLFLFGGLLL